MRKSITLACFLAFSSIAYPGDIRLKTHQDTGWKIYSIQQGTTIVRLVPAAGCNVMSMQVDGVEYFRQPDNVKELPGVSYGNPILYPMPNRVKDARFSFQGKEFSFTPNSQGNFIHGLVNKSAFKVTAMSLDESSASITCQVSFENGTDLHQRFPMPHLFSMTVTVTQNAVRWTYEVNNSEGNQAVPFGVALHPVSQLSRRTIGNLPHDSRDSLDGIGQAATVRKTNSGERIRV